MWWEFRLCQIEIALFHSHGQENSLKSGVNNGRGNLFNKGMKSVKMKNR